MQARRWLGALLIVGSVLAGAVPGNAGAGTAGRGQAPAAVASVRWIFHGVTVRSPHGSAAPGKKNQKLYNQYGVETGANQRTSLGFADHTLLHVNQKTSLVLRTPHITQVTKGEVDEVLTPGTNHRIETPAAVASAIGTNFDVRLHRKVVTERTKKGAKPKKKVVVEVEVIVVEGVVDVRNKQGDVVVESNRETVVTEGKPPSKPVVIDSKKATTWTTNIPKPDVPPGKNIALHDNGGHVIGVSSERKPSPFAAHLIPAAPQGSAAAINDGLPSTSWSTAAGANRNQWIILEFASGGAYQLTDLVIDPAANGGDPAANDMKNFQIWISTTGTADADFSKVFSGQTTQSATLQRFHLLTPVMARYLKLVALDNYGGSSIDVAELEVVSPSPLGATTVSTLTPTPTSSAATSIPIFTPTASVTPAATDTPTDTPAPTPTPTNTPVLKPTILSTPLPTFTPIPTATDTPTLTSTPCFYRQCG